MPQKIVSSSASHHVNTPAPEIAKSHYASKNIDLRRSFTSIRLPTENDFGMGNEQRAIEEEEDVILENEIDVMLSEVEDNDDDDEISIQCFYCQQQQLNKDVHWINSATIIAPNASSAGFRSKNGISPTYPYSTISLCSTCMDLMVIRSSDNNKHTNRSVRNHHYHQVCSATSNVVDMVLDTVTCI